MFVATPPRFKKEMTPEKQEGVRKSMTEVENMDFREIHCPFCKSYLFDAFADFIGHIAVKCQLCKGIVPINPAYFHKMRAKRAMSSSKYHIIKPFDPRM